MFHSTRQKTSPDALLKYQICVRLSFIAFLALPQLSRELFRKIMAGETGDRAWRLSLPHTGNEVGRSNDVNDLNSRKWSKFITTNKKINYGLSQICRTIPFKQIKAETEEAISLAYTARMPCTWGEIRESLPRITRNKKIHWIATL